MEHPEKALFDEVRSLRNELEDSLARVLKIETDYNERVYANEVRKLINDRLDKKIEEFKSDNSRISFIINFKEYTFSKKMFSENVFESKFNLDEDSIELDISKRYFKGIIEIIRIGHEYFGKNLPRLLTLDRRELLEDRSFILTIIQYFSEDSLDIILDKFKINYTYIGQSDILESHTIINQHLNHTFPNAESVDDIKNKHVADQPTAFFLGVNGILEIKLKQKIRVKKIYIRPYYGNSKWQPTSGNTNTKISVSINGIDWENLKNVPSTYGTGSKTDVTLVDLDKARSFKYIRFETNSSNMFSLNYLSFSS